MRIEEEKILENRRRNKLWRDKNNQEINRKRREKYHNKDKFNKDYQERKALYRKKSKGNSLRRNYGISMEFYNKLFQEQEGRCKICEIHQFELKEALSVDHDHTSGRIRGLLCGKCNKSLGLLDDSLSNLDRAIKYLKNEERKDI